MTPAAMAALMARALPGARGWSEAEFADLMQRNGAIVTGGANAFVIGQAIAGEAEIFMVATAPDARRQGHARRALQDFHAAAQSAGADRVILDVAADNSGAIALYQRAGYRQIAERKDYYPRSESPAISALILEKRL